ncbi:unnamed protein product [Calicophoron daubneyi]|uniref:Uncharacterized protein n=1 Tax=Calicophoron daubneyi TaxID=300641 RepID=A0AAV2T5L2_CALDB
MAAMLAGNMNMKSASTLCRNRDSTAPGIPPQPSSLPPSEVRNNPETAFSNFQNVYPLPPPTVYFYDRDPEVFRFVLDYYRTGELHLPSTICGPFVRKELIFWGIDESLIGPCCMPAYMRYDEEKRTKNTLFRDCFEDIDSMKNLVKYSRGWKKWRYRMWLFMDHPSSSLPAKAWASVLLVLMITSVMCYCLSTHDSFRRSTDIDYRSELLMGSHHSSVDPHMHQNLSNLTYGYFDTTAHLGPTSPITSSGRSDGTPREMLSSMQTTPAQDSSRIITICYDSLWNPNPKVLKDCSTEPAWGLVITDVALNCLFTAEFMLKILLAPDKPRFLSSIVSILDMIILFSFWVYMALFYYYYYYPKTWATHVVRLNSELSGYLWLMNILSMTQAMRILRIFKISKVSRSLRVLILTVKKSIPELVLLGFLLMNGMFFFSSLIYMAEYRVTDTFPNIPQAFWWSIITLTSVGYGDMHPKGGAGYFVGSLTAICGCVVTGLAIPIIGNNFNTYYKYMKNQLMEDKYLKNLRKDLEFTIQPGGKSGIGAVVEKSGVSLPGRNPKHLRTGRERQANLRRRGIGRKVSGMLHFGSDPFKRILSKQTSSRNSKLGIGTKQKTGSQQALTENQHKEFAPEVRSSPKADGPPDLGRSSFQAANGTYREKFNANLSVAETVEYEKRGSLVHPLATDNVLNSLMPSRVSPGSVPPSWFTPEEVEADNQSVTSHFTVEKANNVAGDVNMILLNSQGRKMSAQTLKVLTQHKIQISSVSEVESDRSPSDAGPNRFVCNSQASTPTQVKLVDVDLQDGTNYGKAKRQNYV